MKAVRTSIRLAGLVVCLLCLGPGCATVPESDEKLSLLEKAVVPVAMADGTETRLFVRSSLNKHSRAGVHYMTREKWDAAEYELTTAIAEQRGDSRSHFALGLTREKTGKLKAAKDSYATAVEITGGADVIFTGSLKRVEEKIARQEPLEW